jgi:hypothetical protein
VPDFGTSPKSKVAVPKSDILEPPQIAPSLSFASQGIGGEHFIIKLVSLLK